MKKKTYVKKEPTKKSIIVSTSSQDMDLTHGHSQLDINQPVYSSVSSVYSTRDGLRSSIVTDAGFIFNANERGVEESSPERVMFIAVFLQSLLDATKPEYEGEPKASRQNRDCAVKWFSMPECVTASTFEPICELAGINPSYAREHFKLIMEGEREFTP